MSHPVFNPSKFRAAIAFLANSGLTSPIEQLWAEYYTVLDSKGRPPTSFLAYLRHLKEEKDQEPVEPTSMQKPSNVGWWMNDTVGGCCEVQEQDKRLVMIDYSPMPTPVEELPANAGTWTGPFSEPTCEEGRQNVRDRRYVEVKWGDSPPHKAKTFQTWLLKFLYEQGGTMERSVPGYVKAFFYENNPNRAGLSRAIHQKRNATFRR